MIAGHLLADSGVASYYPLDRFGHDLWWVIIVKVLVVFVFLMLTTLFMIWCDRRVMARMQQRLGPNRVGPFGLLQALVDGIKIAFKENIVPRRADKWVFFFAPAVSATAAFMAFAVIPVGGVVSMGGHKTALQITDLPVAVLYILACSSFGVYGAVLGGWAGGSTYSLLGGLRSAAQVISYEVAMGLALVSVFLYSGSLSTSQIVAAQNHGHGWGALFGWNALPLLPAMIVYAVSAVGETQRTPFDLAEAEGELVAGYHTEYSSLRFALYYLAEYVNMTTVSALATTAFLGGWRPFPIPGISHLVGWWGLLWFAIKIFAILFVFVWLRGTLPRFRYDQFMRLGWKVLVPTSVVWLMLVAAVKASRQNVHGNRWFVVVGIAVALVLLVFSFMPQRSSEPTEDELALERNRGIETSGAFPVPSMDALLAERPLTPALVGAGAPAATGTTTGGTSAVTTVDLDEPEENDRA